MEDQNRDLLNNFYILKKEKLEFVLEVKTLEEDRNRLAEENANLAMKLAEKDGSLDELNADVIELKNLLAKLVEVKSSLNKYFDGYYQNFTDKEKAILRRNSKNPGEPIITEDKALESKSKPGKKDEDFWYSAPYN